MKKNIEWYKNKTAEIWYKVINGEVMNSLFYCPDGLGECRTEMTKKNIPAFLETYAIPCKPLY